MEVTRKNFDSVLSHLPNVFQDAQFIAIDTEFTGLKVEGAGGINYFDTLEDLYNKDRLTAETFMAIQIGLVAFFYNEETNKYSHLGFNFYVYPSSYSDINFTCQSTSIKFLMNHGFDFNKLFKEGIPYLKEDELDKLLEKLNEKYEKSSNPLNTTKMEIPSVHKTTVNNISSKIQDILHSNKKETFTTDRFNGYIRKLIYNLVQSQFGSAVFLESNKDETMTVSVGYSSEELKEKQKEKYLIQKQEIMNEVGFCKVIKLLIESKKPIIGHNLLIDILFIINQFLLPLPSSYSELKELVRFLFPIIIDTKYMAAAEMKNISDTSLKCLTEHFENSNTLPEVLIHKNGEGYSIKNKKLHEASYDAYLAGLCFLAMAEQLGKPNLTSNIFKNVSDSPILKNVVNKLSTPKLHDISHMNLGGLDNEPDRVGVYHLTFPKEWTRENISDLFKNCGFINISWINCTSAFIKVKKEYIEEVEKTLMNSNDIYKLLSHSKFKSLNKSSSETSLNFAKEETSKTHMAKNPNNYSSIKTISNDLENKRKIEDIGEVIERPQKKRCSN